jgi:anthranilate synthase component 2
MKKKRFLKHVLLLDNYDSFTYNLKHYISSLGCDVTVVRNDEFDLNLSIFTHVILSPGPGLPENAGVLLDVIRIADGKIPVLGVCLGMQGIGQYLGGELYNQPTVKHGVSESIQIEDSVLFKGIQSVFNVGLYHSWALNEEGDYKIIAKSNSGVVMAIENVFKKLYGVQFHPESIMTEKGKEILSNFLKY